MGRPAILAALDGAQPAPPRTDSQPRAPPEVLQAGQSLGASHRQPHQRRLLPPRAGLQPAAAQAAGTAVWPATPPCSGPHAGPSVLSQPDRPPGDPAQQPNAIVPGPVQAGSGSHAPAQPAPGDPTPLSLAAAELGVLPETRQAPSQASSTSSEAAQVLAAVQADAQAHDGARPQAERLPPTAADHPSLAAMHYQLQPMAARPLVQQLPQGKGRKGNYPASRKPTSAHASVVPESKPKSWSDWFD